MGANETWIRQSYQEIQGRLSNLSVNYTNKGVIDFNGGQSIPTSLASGYYGPYDQFNTVLYNISLEKNDVCGNRLSVL